MMRDSKDDSGRFSGLLSSSGSPRVGFSRSSSRLSLQDDLDDCDFSCPFDVDDVEASDSPSRYFLKIFNVFMWLYIAEVRKSWSSFHNRGSDTLD